MQLLIKSKDRLEISQDIKEYIFSKIGRVISNLPSPSVCEVVLSDANGQKGGIDKLVEISCTVAKVKNPVHIQAISSNFYQSIDLAQGKIKRALHSAKH